MAFGGWTPLTTTTTTANATAIVCRFVFVTVVRVSLLTQNLSVTACCVSVCVRLTYEELWWRHLLETFVIILAVVAQLASVAYKIAIEKDWIVVVAAGNKSLLASMACHVALCLRFAGV